MKLEMFFLEFQNQEPRTKNQEKRKKKKDSFLTTH